MADLLNASFGRSLHTTAEYRTFVTRSPSFRHELNLVAEAPDGLTMTGDLDTLAPVVERLAGT